MIHIFYCLMAPCNMNFLIKATVSSKLMTLSWLTSAAEYHSSNYYWLNATLAIPVLLSWSMKTFFASSLSNVPFWSASNLSNISDAIYLARSSSCDPVAYDFPIYGGPLENRLAALASIYSYSSTASSLYAPILSVANISMVSVTVRFVYGSGS